MGKGFDFTKDTQTLEIGLAMGKGFDFSQGHSNSRNRGKWVKDFISAKDTQTPEIEVKQWVKGLTLAEVTQNG